MESFLLQQLIYCVRVIKEEKMKLNANANVALIFSTEIRDTNTFGYDGNFIKSFARLHMDKLI